MRYVCDDMYAVVGNNIIMTSGKNIVITSTTTSNVLEEMIHSRDIGLEQNEVLLLTLMVSNT